MYGNPYMPQGMGTQQPMMQYAPPPNPWQARLAAMEQMGGSCNPYRIINVTGEAGARTYQMPPNSSILLLDDTAPIVWFCQTDGAGYKTVTPYTITPYQPEPPTDVRGLEERISRLEAMISESNPGTNAATAPAAGTGKTGRAARSDDNAQ